MQIITPCLWFDGQAEDAANFYVSIFKNSRITALSRYGDAGPGPNGGVMTVAFELDGQSFTGLNGGPMFKFNEAISMIVNCETQTEVDHTGKSFRRRAHPAMRLAEGQVRSVLANRADRACRADMRQGPGQIAASHAGHAADDQDRHRQTARGACGSTL